MCGIWGFVGVDDTISSADGMTGLRSLTHRGPDSWGISLEGDAKITSTEAVPDGSVSEFLGNRRLSILDLSTAGTQPMVAEDGQIRLVYNGEVYNYRELRVQLSKKGYEFESDTDTEVVLRCYQEYGEDCVERLRGMFAFAVRDRGRGTLFGARDRLGIKPFYYDDSGDRIAFSSEVTALLAADVTSQELNERAVDDYLALGAVSAPRTILADVRALLPGHTLTYDLQDGSTTTRCYWRPSFEPSEAGRPERVRELLTESISLRLRSDVPVGAFLSGGLDSSAIVALMREIESNDVRTYSIDFQEQAYSETEYASTVAEAMGTEHTAEVVCGDSVREAMPDIVSAMDQPTVDGVNTYFVSELAAEDGLSVALSGLGSDEIFYGYPTFRQVQLLFQFAKSVPSTLRSPLAGLLERLGDIHPSAPLREIADLLRSNEEFGAAYLAARGLFPSTVRRNLLEADIDPDRIPSEIESSVPSESASHIEDRVSDAELRWYMQNQLLRDTDAMSMSHSLEVRVPFLDSELVEYVCRSPSNAKRGGEGAKPLLRRAVSDIVPSTVLQRDKTGFTFPFAEWLDDELEPVVERAFQEDILAQTPLDVNAARSLREAFRRGEVHWSRPWAVVVLSLWVDEHLTND